jgi:hypothetical protein
MRNNSLDKVVENAVWTEYKKKPSRNIKKLVKTLSREYGVDRQIINDFLRRKIKQSKRFRKGLKIGLATIGFLGLLSWGYLSFHHKSSEDTPFYRIGPKNRIYIGKERDLRKDESVWAFLRPKLQEDYRGYDKVRIHDFLKGKDFMELLREEVSLDPHNRILEKVKEEFECFGLASKYEIRQLRSIDELLDETRSSSTIWLVENMVTEVNGKIRLYKDETIKNGSLRFKTLYNGGVKAEFSFGGDDGHVCLEYRGNIIIRAHAKDRVDNYVAIYCEPMHHQLLEKRAELMNKLLRFEEKDGKFIYHNLEESKSAVRVTDEAVIHGLSHSWLEENLNEFGLTQEDLQQELDQKRKIFIFKGVESIRKLASQMGRRELLQDYMKNPIKYWKIIKAEVPEYKNILPNN